MGMLYICDAIYMYNKLKVWWLLDWLNNTVLFWNMNLSAAEVFHLERHNINGVWCVWDSIITLNMKVSH